MTEPVFERLAGLRGEWRGRGAGRYPTIDSFEYEETLRFEPGELLLHLRPAPASVRGEAAEHRRYMNEHDQDMPEIRNWKWPQV